LYLVENVIVFIDISRTLPDRSGPSGGRDKVEKVLLKVGTVQHHLDVDLVVINVGIMPQPKNLKMWNIDLVDNGIKVDQQMKTSRSGVFACGTCPRTRGSTGRSWPARAKASRRSIRWSAI
jgi:NAD(P)H-nitrite reductase large subunit